MRGAATRAPPRRVVSIRSWRIDRDRFGFQFRTEREVRRRSGFQLGTTIQGENAPFSRFLAAPEGRSRSDFQFRIESQTGNGPAGSSELNLEPKTVLPAA